MNKDVLLRPARPEELDALGALKLRASLAYGDHVAELSALPEAGRLAPESLERTLVAEWQGVAMAFITVAPSGRVEEIEDLFVEPSRWRAGLGAMLVTEVLRRSSGRGSVLMRVVASKRAQAFYERCGFAVVGEVMTQFEPAPLMERRVG